MHIPSPLRPFRLLKQDLGNLRHRYVSDWTVFNQLIFASAVYVFFTNILPGITFASDLYVLTGKSWGTIEVVFSTGLCGVIFSLFSIQPLTILGVTGPFSVLAENIYTLCSTSFDIPFLPFMAWSLIHAGWMHYILAVFNAHDWTMRYVTTFSTEIFSLLNSIIYFHKAIQELQRAHSALSFAAFLYAIIGAIGTMLVAIFLSTAERWAPLFHRYVRMGLTEYAAAISIIIFIGMPHVGELAGLDKQTLQVSDHSFRPSDPNRTTFFVQFWHLPIAWVFAAIIPGLIITILFFFDHEVSSIICTIDRYGTRKPGGFAWDIVLLGTTTALCGILGIPPANGLLPQAPLHSESLMHTETTECVIRVEKADDKDDVKLEVISTRRVYEQRWSSFLHAAVILVFISPPLQHVLGLTPTSVLAGLFMFMGEQSLSVNPILFRSFHLLIPPSELPALPGKVKEGYRAVHAYTITQILVTVVIFVITLTKAAPAFPIVIIACVPVRLLIMNRIWGRETLRFVDAWACREGTPEGDEDARTAAMNGDEEGENGEPEPNVEHNTAKIDVLFVQGLSKPIGKTIDAGRLSPSSSHNLMARASSALELSLSSTTPLPSSPAPHTNSISNTVNTMAARVIDLTGSSPPRKKVKTSSNDQAMTQALLAHAINAASPELLRVTLHALGATSKDFAQALSNMLLVTPRIQMSEDADVDANSNDSEEEEEEEDDDDEEHYEAGVITQTTHNMRWQPGPARTRYALCVNCEEEFDVTDNVDDEGCMYHDGELEVDQDMFVDHDENCHGPMDSEDNRRDYPENFIYSCCDEDGQAEGCQTGRHVERS